MDTLIETLSTGGLYIGRTWLRYGILCCGAYVVFWVVFAQALAHRRCQPVEPDRKILRAEFFSSLSGSIFVLLPVILCVPLYRAGLLGVDVNAAPAGPVEFLLSFLLVIIGADAWFYWTHRAMHDSRVYRWTHRLHHLSTNPSPLASYSFGALEGIILGLYFPLVLLTPVNVWVLTAFVLYFALTEAYVHLGYEIMPRWFARSRVTKWIGTSVFHNMHHENGAYNFAVYFTWWDRLMGTIHPEYEDRFEQITAQPLFRPSRQRAAEG